MVYLDLEKKVWKIRSKEYPVKEDLSMKQLKWFKDKYKSIIKSNEEGKLTQSEALEFDELWWTKLCEVGLDTTMEDVMDSDCTEKEFRELMAEVYNFLLNISTIDEARLSDLYAPKTKIKE